MYSYDELEDIYQHCDEKCKPSNHGSRPLDRIYGSYSWEKYWFKYWKRIIHLKIIFSYELDVLFSPIRLMHTWMNHHICLTRFCFSIPFWAIIMENHGTFLHLSGQLSMTKQCIFNLNQSQALVKRNGKINIFVIERHQKLVHMNKRVCNDLNAIIGQKVKV